jgi:hypothetical protein
VKRIGPRLAMAAALALGFFGAAPAPAAAHGWHGGHSRVFLGLNFGAPAYYYPPPYYYYYPPPVYYVPPPRVVYAPPPAPVCHTFRGDATIDASGAPFYGTACLEADGRWHIVN